MTIMKRSPEREEEEKREREREREREIELEKKHITNWASHEYRKNNLRMSFVQNRVLLRHRDRMSNWAMHFENCGSSRVPSRLKTKRSKWKGQGPRRERQTTREREEMTRTKREKKKMMESTVGWKESFFVRCCCCWCWCWCCSLPFWIYSSDVS